MSVFPRPLAALIFDLDGVLVDTANSHYRAWKQLADELGIAFDETANQALKGVDRLTSFDRLVAGSGRCFTAEERVALANRKDGWYREEISRITPSELLPGARSVLAEASGVGLKLALASASRNAGLVVDRLVIREYFEVIIDPVTVPHGKPAPDLFIAAATALCVQPADCLGIEDSIAGIAAIKAASMWALGIGSDEVLSGADRVIPRISAFDLSEFLSVAPDRVGAICDN